MSEAAIPKPRPFGGIKPVKLEKTEEPKKPKKEMEKKPFILQPRLTARPFKGHPGLEDLKKHLGRKKK